MESQAFAPRWRRKSQGSPEQRRLQHHRYFARDVSAHRTRYGLKLDAMRYEHPEVRADEVIQ